MRMLFVNLDAEHNGFMVEQEGELLTSYWKRLLTVLNSEPLDKVENNQCRRNNQRDGCALLGCFIGGNVHDVLEHGERVGSLGAQHSLN
jgi:hypothetical protein